MHIFPACPVFLHFLSSLQKKDRLCSCVGSANCTVFCTVNLAIGQFTPPVGTNLFVASSLRIPGHRVGVEGVAKACLPMIAAAVLVLLLVTYVPQVTTCLIGA